MRISRLAVVSPLPPVRSGITDYSLDLFSRLGELVEVHAVGPPSSADRANPPIPGVTETLSPEEFLAQDLGEYDAVFYQIGNSFEHHGFLLPLMTRVPGIAVIHDCCLQHLALGASIRAGDLRRARAHLEPSYGPQEARVLARKLLMGSVDPNVLFFFAPYVLSSRGVLVHNEFARRKVAEMAPDTPVAAIPMGVPEVDHPIPEISRSSLDLPEEGLILASINTLAHTKRLGLVLEALTLARERGADIHLLIIGGGKPDKEATKRLRDPALSGVVTRTGWTDPERYQNLTAAADLVIDLRHPSGGETSASLMRALALGTPAILSEQGSFLDVPASCSVKIPTRDGEVEAAAEVLVALARERSRVGHMSEAAANWSREHLGLGAMAEAYVEFADRVRDEIAPVEIHPGLRAGAMDPLTRAAVSSLFNAGRFRFMLKKYGVPATLKRATQFMDRRPGMAP